MKTPQTFPTYDIEKGLIKQGFKAVCGIDEAGRGPLAGPVCAAAVILPVDTEIEGLNDSKKLTEKKREALYDVIMQKALAVSVCLTDEKRIDEINILQATFESMRRAVEDLAVRPDCAIIDGNQKPGLSIPEFTVVKGDSKSMSVAAASVIAKVTRDRLMLDFDRLYPEYQFAKHKGYGTKLHYEMIEKYGILPIHRKTFLKKVLDKK